MDLVPGVGNSTLTLTATARECCEYGKGPGLLAVRLERKLLQDTEIGVIVCDTRTAEFSACSGVLRKYARNIVIGVR